MTISHTDISFKLEFPVGRKYVAAQFNLRKGEDTSAAVDQFMTEFDIPIYLHTSLLNMLESMLDQEYIHFKDNQDIHHLETINNLDQDLNKKIDELAHQFSEKTHYWNSLVKNEETEEQKNKEERIKIFLYLVNKNNETKEKIINQEEIFATSFNLLLSRRKEELNAINEQHSTEMQEVANKGIKGEEVERLVSENVKRLDIVEARYDIEIRDLKKKQCYDFTTFLNDLYWLETTKDELEQVDEEFNNITKSQPSSLASSPLLSSSQQQSNNTTPDKQQQGGGVFGIADKVQQRASSFFNFGFGKKNQTPNNTSSTNLNQSQQQPNTPTSPTNTSTPSTPIIISPELNSTKRKDSLTKDNSMASSPQKSSLISNSLIKKGSSTSSSSSSSSQQQQLLYHVLESCNIAVGVQKKKIFEFRLIDASPLHLCRPVSTGEYLKSKRIEYIQTLYSDSLSAVILLADPSLSFSSTSEKMFVQYCNMSTELHFEPIDVQIEQFRQSLGTGIHSLKNGDFFITKHSNLSDVQVVFHLLADKKNRTPWGESQLATTSDVAKGLRNILLTASKYGIGTLTIPIALTEADVEMNITNSVIANRTTSILSVVRASLTSLHEMTSIKTIQFSIPPSLDGGNTLGMGPVSQKWRSAINPFIYEQHTI